MNASDKCENWEYNIANESSHWRAHDNIADEIQVRYLGRCYVSTSHILLRSLLQMMTPHIRHRCVMSRSIALLSSHAIVLGVPLINPRSPS